MNTLQLYYLPLYHLEQSQRVGYARSADIRTLSFAAHSNIRGAFARIPRDASYRTSCHLPLYHLRCPPLQLSHSRPKLFGPDDSRCLVCHLQDSTSTDKLRRVVLQRSNKTTSTASSKDDYSGPMIHPLLTRPVSNWLAHCHGCTTFYLRVSPPLLLPFPLPTQPMCLLSAEHNQLSRSTALLAIYGS